MSTFQSLSKNALKGNVSATWDILHQKSYNARFWKNVWLLQFKLTEKLGKLTHTKKIDSMTKVIAIVRSSLEYNDLEQTFVQMTIPGIVHKKDFIETCKQTKCLHYDDYEKLCTMVFLSSERCKDFIPEIWLAMYILQQNNGYPNKLLNMDKLTLDEVFLYGHILHGNDGTYCRAIDSQIFTVKLAGDKHIFRNVKSCKSVAQYAYTRILSINDMTDYTPTVLDYRFLVEYLPEDKQSIKDAYIELFSLFID